MASVFEIVHRLQQLPYEITDVLMQKSGCIYRRYSRTEPKENQTDL